MKLLKHYSYASDAEDDADRLEKQGIPTYVSAKYSQNLSRIYTGALKAGLWILIDAQYEDAYKFLNNSKHKITTGIEQEKIREMKKMAKPRVFDALNTALAYGAVFVFFLFLYILFEMGKEQI